ncbi:MAG: hypothetical protein ACK5P5_08485, partial [Pseudobdellovibrionaceae bacterium]
MTKIKQENADRFSQQGQSVIESLIMAGCLLPLICGFFQLMLFFSYQHISNYLVHETLICLQENQTRQKAAYLKSQFEVAKRSGQELILQLSEIRELRQAEALLKGIAGLEDRVQ